MQSLPKWSEKAANMERKGYQNKSGCSKMDPKIKSTDLLIDVDVLLPLKIKETSNNQATAHMGASINTPRQKLII